MGQDSEQTGNLETGETSRYLQKNSEQAYVSSWSTGMSMMVLPIAQLITDHSGPKLTARLGILMACCGIGASAYMTSLYKFGVLYPTHGLFFGGGLGLLHDSTSVCVKYHYHESRWITHILPTAAPMATVAVSFFIKPLLRSVGLELSRQVISTFGMLFVIYWGGIIHDVPATRKVDSTSHSTRHIHYVFLVTGIAIISLGYNVPYTYLVPYAKQIVPESDGQLSLVSIACMSAVGRVFFGCLADNTKANRLLLLQIAMVFMAISVASISFATSFSWIITLSLSIGLADGCFKSLITRIAEEIWGPNETIRGSGYLNIPWAISLIVGPYFASFIYSRLKSYIPVFILGGIPPLLGAAILTFAHIKKEQQFAIEQASSGKNINTVDEIKPQNFLEREDGDFTSQAEINRLQEKRKRKLSKEERDEERAPVKARKTESTEKSCCVCKQPYDPNRFYVRCDVCNNSFHGECVFTMSHGLIQLVSHKMRKKMTPFICEVCQKRGDQKQEEVCCISAKLAAAQGISVTASPTPAPPATVAPVIISTPVPVAVSVAMATTTPAKKIVPAATEPDRYEAESAVTAVEEPKRMEEEKKEQPKETKKNEETESVKPGVQQDTPFPSVVLNLPVAGTPWSVVWTVDGLVWFMNPSSRITTRIRPPDLLDNPEVDKLAAHAGAGAYQAVTY